MIGDAGEFRSCGQRGNFTGTFCAAGTRPSGAARQSLTVGSPPLGTPTLSVGPKQPFQVAFGPGRLHGTFDLQYASEADEMIKAWEALKMFLKKRENEEAAN